MNTLQRNPNHFFYFKLVLVQPQSRGEKPRWKNQMTQMQEVDLYLSTCSEIMTLRCDYVWWGQHFLSHGERDYQLKERIWDHSPCDFILKLNPIALFLIQVLSSHTFHCASVTVETLWNFEILTCIPEWFCLWCGHSPRSIFW